MTGAGSHFVPFMAARAGRQTVYVVTADRTLFGVHRMDDNGAPTTHVLGFGDKGHAEALAIGLQTYRDRHGTFPAIDMLETACTELIADLDTSLVEDYTPNANAPPVNVEATSPEGVLSRLMGTAIVFSVLWQDADGAHTWEDMAPPNSRPFVVGRLKWIWQQGYATHLKPKPARPVPAAGSANFEPHAVARVLTSHIAGWKWMLIAQMLRMMM